MYGEGKTERKDVTIKNFERWLDWAAEKDLGLDFNASFFTHSMMKDNLSLTSPDKAVRDYWIEAGIGAREISLEFGKRLGIKSYNNIWIPDGLKDIPADRFAYRQRLIEKSG
jgi:L-rhamnose isomerase